MALREVAHACAVARAPAMWVDAVHADLATVRRVQPGYEAGERRLPGPDRPGDGEQGSRWDVQGQVLECWAACARKGEGHLRQGDRGGGGRWRGSVGVRLPLVVAVGEPGDPVRPPAD